MPDPPSWGMVLTARPYLLSQSSDRRAADGRPGETWLGPRAVFGLCRGRLGGTIARWGDAGTGLAPIDWGTAARLAFLF